MYLLRCAIALIMIVLLTSCGGDTLSSLSKDDINNILAKVNEEDLAFKEGDVKFDSILTYAGTRTYLGEEQRIKMKLFYFGSLTRGYYNLADQDDKNLQVFGRRIDDNWAFKCVTKINMEEAGGYMILDDDLNGIWSSGHINFDTEKISLEKKDTDYQDLSQW